MRRYNNNMLANTTRVGLEVNAYNDYVGGEAFISDITFQQSRVMGALGFVKPLGWMSDKDWDSTVETLKAYGGVTTPLKAADLYTNEFIPSGSEFVPPPAK